MIHFQSVRESEVKGWGYLPTTDVVAIREHDDHSFGSLDPTEGIEDD